MTQTIINKKKKKNQKLGTCEIRTHAPHGNGAYTQRLRPLGQSTFIYIVI